MKVNIDSDEWYPVYYLTMGEDMYEEEIIEIPADKVKWIQKTFIEFQKVQAYLKRLEK